MQNLASFQSNAKIDFFMKNFQMRAIIRRLQNVLKLLLSATFVNRFLKFLDPKSQATDRLVIDF